MRRKIWLISRLSRSTRCLLITRATRPTVFPSMVTGAQATRWPADSREVRAGPANGSSPRGTARWAATTFPSASWATMATTSSDFT